MDTKEIEKQKKITVSWYKYRNKNIELCNDRVLIAYYMRRHHLTRELSVELVKLNREIKHLRKDGLGKGEHCSKLIKRRDEIKKIF
jgi:hypothetical protein